ncbi:ATP-grasp domain-containing protein [Acinetobacter seifertii]|uniref:ATP-grasp domain-containing protein n=1 Tax=Acinetobacter seifertii TaxID=1530123 RepID=UPI001581086A|nr:ATP-grasp domain-containing protein [Acinetobacter seifertii]NUF85484.1 ATP-grasp domain-containing protein [Acinetobacter seifertii]
MKKVVVFIETNFTGLDALTYCKEKGYHSVLITDSYERFLSWFPASSLSKIDQASEIINVNNSNDLEELISVLKKFEKVDAILTFAEIRTLVTAKLAKEMNVKHSNPQAIEIAQNKSLIRKILAENKVEEVSSVTIKDINFIDDEIEKNNLKYPFFIKPLHGHSSIGASVCRNDNDLLNYKKKYIKSNQDGISDELVIEDYLEGQLVSVETLTFAKGQHAIIGVADRDIIHDCVEIGSSFTLDDRIASLAKEKAKKILNCIHYDYGSSHIELIVNDEEARLVEVNTRVGGSGHSIMMDLATGRSIVGDCIECSLGNLKFDENLYSNKKMGASWQCFVPNKEGIIKKLPNIEILQKMKDITNVWFHYQENEKVEDLKSNFSWVVQVMAQGENREAAKFNALTCINYIRENSLVE